MDPIITFLKKDADIGERYGVDIPHRIWFVYAFRLYCTAFHANWPLIIITYFRCEKDITNRIFFLIFCSEHL